jgi:hypothetical protein
MCGSESEETSQVITPEERAAIRALAAPRCDFCRVGRAEFEVFCDFRAWNAWGTARVCSPCLREPGGPIRETIARLVDGEWVKTD